MSQAAKGGHSEMENLLHGVSEGASFLLGVFVVVVMADLYA